MHTPPKRAQHYEPTTRHDAQRWRPRHTSCTHATCTHRVAHTTKCSNTRVNTCPRTTLRLRPALPCVLATTRRIGGAPAVSVTAVTSCRRTRCCRREHCRRHHQSLWTGRWSHDRRCQAMVMPLSPCSVDDTHTLSWKMHKSDTVWRRHELIESQSKIDTDKVPAADAPPSHQSLAQHPTIFSWKRVKRAHSLQAGNPIPAAYLKADSIDGSVTRSLVGAYDDREE